MHVTKITISGLRNIESLSLEPVNGVNQVVGENGAGKTSVLESLHLLASGRSFRTRKIPRLLSKDVDELSVRVEFTDPVSNTEHQAGILKNRAGETQLKLDYQSLNSIVEVARLLPVKVVNPDSHRLVQEGPDQRREFIDWGVFHVEQSFFQIWKQFRRALHQRNQMLKMHRTGNELEAWNRELAVAGEIVHQQREKYVSRLQPLVESFANQFGMKHTLVMRYRAGWAAGTSLIDALSAEQDQAIPPAFTTVGPHRAELALSSDGQPSRDVLSRGEQKLLVYALHFAQLELFRQATGRLPVVLLDDLAAELDSGFRERVIRQLPELGMQAFITGNEPLPIKQLPSSKIHQLVQGKLAEVI